jgi:chitinase
MEASTDQARISPLDSPLPPPSQAPVNITTGNMTIALTPVAGAPPLLSAIYIHPDIPNRAYFAPVAGSSQLLAPIAPGPLGLGPLIPISVATSTPTPTPTPTPTQTPTPTPTPTPIPTSE